SGKTTLINYILKEKQGTKIANIENEFGSLHGKKIAIIENEFGFLLDCSHGKKIAIIENEFGSLDIDSSLVKDKLQAKEDVISMDNGCVCCTANDHVISMISMDSGPPWLDPKWHGGAERQAKEDVISMDNGIPPSIKGVRGDLVKAFITLSEREEKYDAVIIETTGMADPAPVAYTFNNKAEVGAKYRIDAILCVVGAKYRIDAILCVVDAKHIQQHLDDVRAAGVVNEAVNQVAFADKILLNKIDLVTP
ncbi:hypothetical protein T484DRAFT_1829668, partial [Baffinella frigidus]